MLEGLEISLVFEPACEISVLAHGDSVAPRGIFEAVAPLLLLVGQISVWEWGACLPTGSAKFEAAMSVERYFDGEIDVLLADGSRVHARVTADEIMTEGKEVYCISLVQGSEVETAQSDVDFFEALIELRLELEKRGALLCCFGASENVYPSGMQRDMGPAILAYKMRLGQPSLTKDMVNIFYADETVVPATVEQQARFHRQWADGFRKR
ncbi:hypothetical protein [Bradyrhizobium sp. HKCCYLS20291]|uniref:hypothetical protein n=1 Tax=Bradyrhizobium sp. HKCCYLS20291 TaxID=3420766 RepID=UPI003EBB04F3